MSKHLLIVESPTKAKTISKFLPNNYMVIASIGHVKDLPRSATDIPKKHKQESWARLGIDIEHDFSPLYVSIKGKSKIISEIKSKMKDAESLLLATDEDREGESIAWHLIEILKPKIPVHRMVFHEITKSAIQTSLNNYRDIDTNLVKAQETRRILDRLFGYKLSELIWKKIAYKLSAGRVQSPGLLLLVERERERYLFRKATYNDIIASFLSDEQPFTAKLQRWNNQKIATGSDFDNTGNLKKDVLILDSTKAQSIIDQITSTQFTISNIEEKPQNLSPPAPFITSTLQQESNRRLKITARETMRTAQSLYEQGYITYMRTDSYVLSGQALQATRNYIQQNFDAAYLPEKPNFYGKKSKNAQEAHEAIRPAGSTFAHPNSVPLSGREKELYNLIWQRTIASQMSPAKKLSTNMTITSHTPQGDTAEFSSNGSVLVFPGFLALYTYSKVDDKLLPKGLSVDKQVEASEFTIEPHETKPPSRYNDASLIKQLEALDIGRPSTYASIINTLLERNYAQRVNQTLIPTLTGFAVAQFLEKNFPEYVDYEFTSIMENTLDKIAIGEQNYLDYLRAFYFGDTQQSGLEKKVLEGAEIDSDESQRIRLPELDEKYQIRVGRYGPFVIIQEPNKEKENFSLPHDCHPSDLHEEYIKHLAEIKRKGPEPIGTHPDTGECIYSLTGRFGPYFQLGEITEENPKPKRASIPRTISTADMTVELAVKLLSIPKELGAHPEHKEPIIAAIGRFGPYIKCGELTRSLKKNDDIYTISFERACELLAEQPAKRKRGSTLIKDWGSYNNKKLGLYLGPHGYYLKIGTKNVRLPDDKKEKEQAEALSKEQVVEIIKNT